MHEMTKLATVAALWEADLKGQFKEAGTDSLVEEVERALRCHLKGSMGILRHLQTIALFLPSSVLDMTKAGKAYCDVTVAMLGIRAESLSRLMEQASRYIEGPSHPPSQGRNANDKITESVVECQGEEERQWEAFRLYSLGKSPSERGGGGEKKRIMIFFSHPHF